MKFIFLGIVFFATAANAQDARDQSESLARIQELRSEMGSWDHAVLGFRQDHHFTLMTGYSRSIWHFKSFGSLTNEKIETSGYYTKFRYAFHLPIYKGFGYYLGSSVGYQNDVEKPKKMELISTGMLPGILAGFVQNFGPGTRLGIGIDYYLERWSGLGERDGVDEDPTISVTARAADFYALVDIFYKLKWAIRVEFHRRVVEMRAPRDAGSYGVDARITRTDDWYGTGLIYHLM